MERDPRGGEAATGRPSPLFWLVAKPGEPRREIVRTGESSYFSGLFIDADGLLQWVNPDLTPREMTPSCSCCTHTLDGVRFGDGGDQPRLRGR